MGEIADVWKSEGRVDGGSAEVMDFTAAYAKIAATYPVPPGSTIQSIDEVDRPGNRISVSKGSAYGLWLESNSQQTRSASRPASPAPGTRRQPWRSRGGKRSQGKIQRFRRFFALSHTVSYDFMPCVMATPGRPLHAMLGNRYAKMRRGASFPSDLPGLPTTA